MTVTRWAQLLLTLGALIILAGNGLLWPEPVLILGVALMAPMGILGFIYLRNVS
jgi:hypothetical protein